MVSLTESLNQLWLNRFANRTDCHGIQTSSGGHIWVYEPFTEDLLQKHLDGKITLSVPNISAEHTCKWVCFDDDTDELWRLDRIEMLCDNACLTPLKEGARANRAGHIWLFFDVPLPLATAYHFGQVILRGAGIQKLEVFPKQGAIATSGKGNLVKMPLGIHKKLLPDIVRMTFAGCESLAVQDQLEWFAQQPLSSTQTVIDLVAKSPLAPEVKPRKLKKTSQKGNILELIPDNWPLQQVPNNSFIARCPMCARENGDNSGDNLNISEDGSLAWCFKGERTHDFRSIIYLFRALKQQQQRQPVETGR